jgi:glycosyltransferase involved in cell wall biosynthesis
MRVVFLTTSWPRDPADYAGRFVADLADRLRACAVEVDVVSPGLYRDFGLAYRAGLAANMRRRPWAVPPMLVSMALAVRRAARSADLVHAHWLHSAGPALVSGRPVVVTLHGSDVELARRIPAVTRPLLRRARVVVAVSEALAAEARRLGARNVSVIPNGVDVPVKVGKESSPPEVLFVGRLVPEKGVEDLVAVADGLNLVVVGDGPLRRHLPAALGPLSREEVERRYARAAVVVCPSRREGFGLACAEAMAHGRPVVASAVGGLRELVVDGETGLLVPPCDAKRLRAAIDRLLADGDLRRRLGEAGRRRIAERYGWDRVVDATVACYESALRADDSDVS